MNLEMSEFAYSNGVVIKPTMLPAMKRNTPFAIPSITSLRYDIIIL